MFARNSRVSSASTSMELQSLEQRRLMAVDLVVESINVTNGLHTSTSELTEATITVKNIGTTAGGADAKLRMRFSGDSQWGNADDLILNYKTIPYDLAPGETYTYSTAQRASAQPTGSYQFLAYIDGFNTVPESNEDNNEGERVVRLPWRGSGRQGCPRHSKTDGTGGPDGGAQAP